MSIDQREGFWVLAAFVAVAIVVGKLLERRSLRKSEREKQKPAPERAAAGWDSTMVIDTPTHICSLRHAPGMPADTAVLEEGISDDAFLAACDWLLDPSRPKIGARLTTTFRARLYALAGNDRVICGGTALLKDRHLPLLRALVAEAYERLPEQEDEEENEEVQLPPPAAAAPEAPKVATPRIRRRRLELD